MFKKSAIIFISSILLLNSLIMPFAVANAAPPLPPPTPAPPTAPTSSAPSTWYNQGFTDWYAKVYGDESPPSEIFGERYTAAQVQWILYSLFAFPINMLGNQVQALSSCIMAAQSAGTKIIDDVKCVTTIVEFSTKIVDILKTSGLVITDNTVQTNSLAEVVSDYRNRPISGIKYTANLVSKFTSIPTANAQGFGFGAVDGLQQYWNGFRDIAYALSVLVVIVFSFMIMFRVKLSPQLVISVQSALPKIVGALVLATFSYAIAGFVIDLSYVIGGLFSSLMALAGFAKSFEDAWHYIVPIGPTTVLGGFTIVGFMAMYTMLFFVAALVSFAGTVSGLSLFGFLASILMVLLSIWVLLLLIWYTLKVPWVLLKNLISLLVSIVIAPVQIVIGAVVPTIGFGIWFKKIIAEALVFPLTGLFMFLAWKSLFASMAASLGQAGQVLFGTPNQNLWAPPILGSSADMAGILWLAVSFTFITMIPKAVDIMKMLIMGQKFDFGTAMGEATMPIIGATNFASSSQQGRYNAALKSEEGVSQKQQWTNNIWSVIRGVSGGKVK